LCLVSKKDVEEFFEIPIIDLETSDGTGLYRKVEMIVLSTNCT
jgi:hypothetical protein